MATLGSPGRPLPAPTKKWKNRLMGKKKPFSEIPREEDNGVGRSLSASRKQKKKGGIMRKFRGKKEFDSDAASFNHTDSSPSNPQSPLSDRSLHSVESYENTGDWPDTVEDRERRALIFQKQQLKERDGFCRRVDAYDGSVIVVDKKPTYEIGNYLGGGVAGVVYEGYRLRPLNEYPLRKGVLEEKKIDAIEPQAAVDTGFFCTPVDFQNHQPCGTVENVQDEIAEEKVEIIEKDDSMKLNNASNQEDVDVAIEATIPGVMLDGQYAPSRSKHFTRAASVQLAGNQQKSLNHGLTEEAVAVKILNPVGYRILQPDGLKDVVVVKKGAPMDSEVKRGLKPMEAKHVWWLVNPNSRNLRTLQRYSGKDENSAVQVDRGSEKKGLRLSLIAGYLDPRTKELRELPLTRCIEIWGHVPFNATDIEFDDMVTAIERVNAGQPPLPFPAFTYGNDQPPSRVGTDTSAGSSSEEGLHPVPLKTTRTGLLRAAFTERQTVHCGELNAYIAIPAVPSKYLKWLRQRRAATKEVRNMMLIGRHRNVLHLFEVLEFIQESKSTMFLIVELVKGGELFDLISSGAGAKGTADIESERMMRKFFYELASGIQYCHKSGIAHRDLKPENLLVHNGADGDSTLKIADFGLSSAFGDHARPRVDNGLIQSASNEGFSSSASQASIGSAKDTFNIVVESSVSAFSFLTCGAMDNLCSSQDLGEGPSPLRRMTSVVGSPHYVAPEIISQSDESKRNGRKKGSGGYDGSKADVWSAGVILYAMLFKSLPFGEDLLRCPRYQSYKKWYDGIRKAGGRRSSPEAALNPVITAAEERDLLGPHWFFPAEPSRESRDLIVAMLNPKAQDRLSIDQKPRTSVGRFKTLDDKVGRRNKELHFAFRYFKILIMSEETKTGEGDYVMMGGNSIGSKLPGLDDPNLSQEDRDHRLAIAMQQEENAAAYGAHKNKHEQYLRAKTNRTARSGTFTRLAAVRDKDQGMLSVPPDYTTEHAYVKSTGDFLPPTGRSEEEILRGATPQQIADFKIAKELQKVEQVGAGTAREMSKIATEDKTEEIAQIHRTGYSSYEKKPRK